MTLYRMKGQHSIAYLWWIVTCLVLQARQAGSPASVSMRNVPSRTCPIHCVQHSLAQLTGILTAEGNIICVG